MSEQSPKPESPRVSPLRTAAAGLLGAASVLIPTAAAIEAGNDVPDLATKSEEAGDVALHFQHKYEGIVETFGKDVNLELDEETGRLGVTLKRDPKLTLEPIEDAFSSLNDTSDDAKRLKWLAIGGAVGLLSAAAIGRPDKSLRRGGSLRGSLVDTSRSNRAYFASLLVFAGMPTALFLSTGNLQKDVSELSRFDIDKVTEVSDALKADIDKLNIEVSHTGEESQVSFLPDMEVIERIEERANSLPQMMPDIESQNIQLDYFTITLASLALIGLAGTSISTASSLGRMSRGEKRGSYVSTEEKGRALLRQQERRALRLPSAPRNHSSVRR